jgi:isoquinoline 1-oxidoreductase beta subunit
MQEAKQNKGQAISRRKFIGVAGGVTFLATASMVIPRFWDEAVPETADHNEAQRQQINLWVHLREDGQITIYNPSSEMGQGSMTALPVILAEEMDADWSKVHIENSPTEPKIYGAGWDGSPGGTMITVGSRTVRNFYHYMRMAGAQARYVLLASVAQEWSVPITALRTEPGFVIHNKDKRRISYGEIVSFVQADLKIPEIPEEQLKNPKDFRLIGSIIPRFDIPAKTDGSAQYSIDVQVPDMVYAVINRSPVHGSTPTLLNEESIKAIPGIVEVVQLDHGIGLIAESLELALKTKNQLQIQWSPGAQAASHTSSEAYSEYEKIAASKNSKSNRLTDEGDVERALQKGVRNYHFDYKNDALYHAQMEPVNAVASVALDGKSVEIWVGTQAPGRTRAAIADVLGIEQSEVKLHRTYLGGGFGRRSTTDFVTEAVELSDAIKRPLKLVWTREDDLQYGMFRPMSLQRMQASVDANGKVQAWQHIVVGTGSRLLGSGAKTDYYSFPSQRVEVRSVEHGIRTKHWRAVGHGPNKFAIEAFVDEIAADLGVDPLDFRLQLMASYPRAQKVLQTAAEMAQWGNPIPAGRGRGLAFAERSGSLGACVCELSVDPATGKIKVHHLWSALDCGVVVQPDNVIAQMEGGFIMGLSSVLKERISFQNGVVQQSNFHDYPILRFNEIPESIEVKLIDSQENPTGVGESAVPLVGGAVANAFGSLTGKRLRHLPFTPDKVLAVL